jgi:hypothetical protein
MADTFGAQSFPLAAPTAGMPAGDVALGYLGQFLKAAINASCDRMWGHRGVCPGRHTVEKIHRHDPQKLFNESKLPCLHIWRGKATRSRFADNLCKKTTRIELAWINEASQEEHLIAREPAMNAIADAIDMAVANDRVPQWIVTGDTDPLTLGNGSSLSHYCNFSRCQVVDDEPRSMTFQRIEEAQALPYYGFVMGLEVDEYQSYDVSLRGHTPRLDASQAANTTITVATIDESAAQQIQWDVP